MGRRLEYFTLGWNLTEAIIGIGAGVIAGSIALLGFGVDSIIRGGTRNAKERLAAAIG